MLHTYDHPKTGGQRYQLWDFASPAPRQVPSAETPLDSTAGKLFPLQPDRWLQVSPVNGLRSQRYELRDGRWQMVGEAFGEPDSIATVSGDGKTMIQFSGTKAGEMKLHGWDVSGNPALKWSIPFAAKPDLSPGLRMWSSEPGSSFAVLHPGSTACELMLYRNTGAKPELTGTIPIKTSVGLYQAAISPDGRTIAHLRDTYYNDIVVEDISTDKARELIRTGEQSGLGTGLLVC
jgi:hypothetical protein